MSKPERIVYCHCAYAQVVPPEVKQEVLQRLAESGVAFDAVADLCELSAKRDPALKQLAEEVAGGGAVKIAACYPRAVKWLFNAAGAPIPEGENAAGSLDVFNMRTDTAGQVVQALLVKGRPIAPVPEPVPVAT